MGVLVDVVSETFLLPKLHFMAAKRALEALAADSPSSFEVPQSVTGSEDLPEALAAAFWSCEANEAGDLVALSYGADKAPARSDTWPRPVLEALAPFVTSGTVVYREEGADRETVYALAKGKVRARTRKRTNPRPVTAAAPTPHAGWAEAPLDSFGIEWRARIPGEHDWFRKRARVAAFLEALARTKIWAQLEEVHSRSTLLPVTPNGGVLPIGDVVARVADGQWGTRWLASRDRETTLTVDVSVFELGVQLRVRDGALARVGSAVIDEVAAALATYAAAHRSGEPFVAHAAPFGRGYMRPVDAARPLLRGPLVLPSGEIHFRANALCTMFDGRPREKGQDRDAARTLQKLAVDSKVPAGATRTEEDGIVTVTFPCDLADRESVRAAAAAHARWIAESADVAQPPVTFVPSRPVAQMARKADDPALEGYALAGRFVLIVEDDPFYFRDRAFFEVAYRAFAKTAYWPELAKPGTAALDAAIAAVITGRNDKSAVLKRGNAVKLQMSPNVKELEITVSATRPVLTKLGVRATRDLVAFIAEVHGALAGRGRLGKGYIAITSKGWDQFVGHGRSTYARRWPPQRALVDIVDLLAVEDGRNGRELHNVRTLAAAPLPAGAARSEVGGLVALAFADDLGDPVATAEACARRAAWLESAQSTVGDPLD